MDFLTTTLASASIPFITWLSVLFHNPYFSILVMGLAFLLMVKFKTSHASPFFLALLVAFFLLNPIKDLSAVPRPCNELLAKVPCPTDASFPSGHATVAGIFILASVGTPLFLPFLALGLFVSFSRLYLGIHTFSDVAAGLALGMIIYALAEQFYAKYRRATR